jgi:hypothetical protein
MIVATCFTESPGATVRIVLAIASLTFISFLQSSD